MPVRVALVARSRNDIEIVYVDDALDASTRAAALHIARLALPVVELPTDTDDNSSHESATAHTLQRVPCESRHSLFARVHAHLIVALLVSADVDERVASQTLDRIATHVLGAADSARIDAVALQRVLKAAVDHANATLRHQAQMARIASTNNSADELAAHLRDETIPLIIDRGEQIESLLHRTSSISSAGTPFRSALAAMAPAEPSNRKPLLCFQSIKFLLVMLFVAAVVAYVVTAAFCGGLLWHRCIKIK
jgi:hypothetical protein